MILSALVWLGSSTVSLKAQYLSLYILWDVYWNYYTEAESGEIHRIDDCLFAVCGLSSKRFPLVPSPSPLLLEIKLPTGQK